MVEIINIGSRSSAYTLLAFALICCIVLIALFFRWFFTLAALGKDQLNMRSRTRLLLLISWPLPLAILGILGTYFICYCHFYSLKIEPGSKLIVSYLWPKCNMSVSRSEIVDISVVRKGTGWKSNQVLVITTSEKKLTSSSPIPNPDELPAKILDALSQREK